MIDNPNPKGVLMPPAHWRQLPPIRAKLESGVVQDLARCWVHSLIDGFKVLRSIGTVTGGSRWLHVSVSRADRLPSWAEVQKVKDEFLGENAEAYQVLTRRQDHVNLHPYCLHLWAPTEGGRRVANLQDLINEEAI